MKKSNRILALLSLVLLVGCNVHPLPRNVSNTNTFGIVKNVRCEAKREVQSEIEDLLALSTVPEIRSLQAFESVTKREFIRAKQPELAIIFDKYDSSVIGYDFLFEITESGANSIDAGLRMPTTKGTFNLSADARSDRQRTGKREFATAETFAELVLLDCETFEKPSKKLIYPLTGSIGMAEIMDTFLKLGKLGSGKGTFTDTITFTTTVGGGFGASAAVNPVMDKWRLVSGNIVNSKARTDVHQVTISLAFPLLDNRKITDRVAIRRSDKARVEKNTFEYVAIQRCIQRAEARENRGGVLRLTAPESYCADYGRRLAELTGR